MRAAILAAAALSACAGGNGSDQVAAIEEMHARILAAHRDRDPAAWTALEADTVLIGNRGTVKAIGRAERQAQQEAYLHATRFSVYGDIAPPIVRVSEDGSMAWLMANVEVVAHRDTACAVDSTHTVWAWIELYERRGDRWLLVGNVSNERPTKLQ
jgi:hypothetical protein